MVELLAELPEVTVIGNKNYYLANKWNSNNIQLTSEMPVRVYVNNNGQLDYTRQYNPSAGYVSGTDPLGEFVVGNAVLNKPLQLVGRATEQTARGTQIKNYYGLNEGNQDITPAMWEYARRNYVKDTGINNNMTEWLNSVDERDIIAFTKWLSKHSPAIAAPLIGGTLYDDKW